MDEDPFDELRRGLRGHGGDDGDRRRLRSRQVLAGLSAAVVLGLAIGVLAASRQPTEHAAAPSPSIEVIDEPSPSSSSTTSPVARLWPAEPIAVAGNEVRSGGHRWSVGGPGDLVAVGDWDCNGTTTAAVLRPLTGRLHVFDAWATADTTATASPGPTVPPGATAIEASGCGRATVRTEDGRSVEVRTAATP